MTKKPFLAQVAEHYFESELLHLRHFIFPSKRAKTFFLHYLRQLAEEAGRVLFAPHCTTINEYILSLNDTLHATDKTELLFDLYDCRIAQRAYVSETEEGEGLDDFLFWGNIILSDFDLIDRYLVDASQLYRNIEGLKELDDLQLDFLTEETKASIEQYFKGFVNTSRLSEEEKETYRSRFLAFWHSLQELYTLFAQHISQTGRAYEGYIYRRVAEDSNLVERLEDKHHKAIKQGIRPLVFVGLFELSGSERSILKQLQRVRLAEFVWDEAVHVIQDRQHPASRLMARNTEMFPSVFSTADRAEEGQAAKAKSPYLPKDVRVYHCASTITEVKALPKILADCEIPLSDKPEELSTAIILSDEQMLLPVVSSIPTDYEYLNVSLGYPLSRTSVSTLINRWIRLILGGYKGSYSVPNILNLLSLQLLTEYYPALGELSRAIRRQKNYMLSGAWIVDTFYPHVRNDVHRRIGLERAEEMDKALPIISLLLKPEEDALAFLRQLDDLLLLLAEPMLGADLETQESLQTELLFDDQDEETERQATRELHVKIGFELNFLMHYQRLLRRLIALLEGRQYGTLSRERAIHLLEGLVRNLTIPFKGDPLHGLQIMGLLESRSLHFDHLIYLSAEEGKLPKRKHSSTFIPNMLRYAYSLPTREAEEAAESYRFYQSIAQCSSLSLLVSEDDSLGSKGEESRYIHQLKLLYDVDVQHISIELPPKAQPRKAIEVNKDTPQTMAQLERYLLGHQDDMGYQRRLSASSLNTYLQCPLKFYYRHIREIKDEQEPSELIGDGDYGTILHDTLAKRLYRVAEGTIIDPSYLDNILAKGAKYVESQVRSVYVEHYSHQLSKRELNSLDLYSIELITTTLMSILEYDRRHCPFVYLHSELELHYECPISYEGSEKQVCFKGFVDRIDLPRDEEGEYLRILDYKTGADEKKAIMADMSDLRSKPHEHKAIIQTLLYCEMLRSGRRASDDKPALPSSTLSGYRLRPGLLITRELIGREESYSPYLRVKQLIEGAKKGAEQELNDYHDLSEAYVSWLGVQLSELFDRRVPFRQSPDTEPCRYCEFNGICRRKVVQYQ